MMKGNLPKKIDVGRYTLELQANSKWKSITVNLKVEGTRW